LSTRFGYTGQVWIGAIGLYYYKTRMYSPVLGRFLQPDPVGYAAGMNLYAYVSGDPINLRDPSGLGPENIIDCLAAAGVDGPDLTWITDTVAAALSSVMRECVNSSTNWAVPNLGEVTVTGRRRGDSWFFIPIIPMMDWTPNLLAFARASAPIIATRRGRTNSSSGRPLNQCEKNALADFIPQEDLNNARLHIGRVPWYLPPIYSGITRGNNIYFRIDAYQPAFPDGLAGLGHELVHVGQYRKGATALSFLLSYIRHGYLGSPLEREAYNMQDLISAELNSLGVSCGGG